MDLDVDPSGDLSGSHNARGGRKFKPKPKLAPVKAKAAVPDISMLPQIAEEKAATLLTNGLVVDTEKHLVCSDGVHKELTGAANSVGLHLDDSANSTEKDASALSLVDAVTDKNLVMSPCFEPIQNPANGSICENEVPASVSNNDSLARRSTFEDHSSAISFSVKLEESSTFLRLDSGEIFCEANCYPEIQNGNEYPVTSGPSSEDINLGMLSNAQCNSDAFHLDDGSIPGLPPKVVVNYSSMSFPDFIGSNPSASDFLMIEEQTGINNSGHADDLHEMPQKEVNDNLEDECSHGRFHVDPSSSFVLGERDGDFDCRVEDEADNNDEECRANPKKRKASKNPKKPAPDKEKTVRKRESPDKPQKKFSHSTRRRKERVKELLRIPQDEIDFLKLPLKDICLLGEHNDMLAKKTAKESRASGTSCSAKDSSHGAYSYDEEDPFGYEQDEEYTDSQAYAREGRSDTLFNSRSFMDREPRARWSKQDTELFYEGIRQFGSNLSMIQQLFPGRTRDHMKKKFQKEGREHPARLTEAMRSRTTDHSYLKMALEQLRKTSGHLESVSIEDDPDDMVGKEETQLDPGTKVEEPTNSKQEEGVSNGGDPAVISQEALDSDGGADDWTYESEL